jgi:hypothetical protein
MHLICQLNYLINIGILFWYEDCIMQISSQGLIVPSDNGRILLIQWRTAISLALMLIPILRLLPMLVVDL